MKSLLLIVLCACSNAADPAVDAPIPHAFDAPPTADAPTAIDGPVAPTARVLVINEVVAAGSPDWFEIVNATTEPVQLSDFLFADSDDATKAVPFPAMILGPGAYYAQDCDDSTASPFKLGSDEQVFVFHADHTVDDSVDWADGDSPANGSYARSPDIFGPYATSTTPTKGAHND